MISPWKRNNTFYIEFSENYFNKGDIILGAENSKMLVIKTYRINWWKKILLFLWFRIEISKRVKVKYL